MSDVLIQLRQVSPPPCRAWLSGLPDEHARTMATDLEIRASAARQPFRLIHLPREATRAAVIGRTTSGVVFLYAAGPDVAAATFYWVVAAEIAERKFPPDFLREMLARDMWISPPQLTPGDEWSLERRPDGRVAGTVTPRLPEDTMPDIRAYLDRHEVRPMLSSKGSRSRDEDESASAPLALRPVFGVGTQEEMRP